MKSILIHWPSLITLGIAAILFGGLVIFRRCYLLNKKSPLLEKDLFRSPGQTLMRRLDQINQEIGINLLYLLSVPLFIYAAYISQLYFGHKETSAIGIVFIAILCITFMAYFLYNLVTFVREKRMIRAAHDSQVAVAQELNQLMRDGYYVYHNFPGDNFDIDHVIVGHTGIFAVETKTRAKPKIANRMQDATVTYDGRALYFPKGDDWKTIDLAKHQASWLSTWIQQSVGEPVAVRAVVVLPGWYVKRISADGIPVINPQQFSSLFTYIKPRPLSEELITRIATQIEQKCREVTSD
ncbi:MAG: nuclease-related domain-containing protein [Desulfobacterales bacterium]